MAGWLATLARRPRRPRRDARAATRPADPAEERLTARALANAIERAMHLGLWSHAERIARSAAALASRSPRLAERLARLRLVAGEPEIAINIIDGCPTSHASLRLLRTVCLIRLGRREEAHSDLLRWSRRSSAPLDARLLLAMLEWESGDEHAAAATLLRNLRHLEDRRTLELLVLSAVASGRPERIERWSTRLRHASAYGAGSPYVDIMLQSLSLAAIGLNTAATEEQIAMLAVELQGAEYVIPTLVEALEIRPQLSVASLLYEAVRRSLDEFVDRARALESLARLALALDDRAAAGEWIKQGLRENPMSATLTMLREALSGGDGDVVARIGQNALNLELPRGKAA
jgi:tetratricopeptide (TPR) repeat protein